MSDVLVIRPCFDDASKHSFRWCEELIKVLKENKRSITDLAGSEATREAYEVAVNREDPDWVIFYDHGTESGLVAQGGKDYVIDNRNVETLSGRVVYTMACLWGSKGGVDAFRAGAKVVWAYTAVFGFTLQEEELFMHCANAGLIYRFEGKTWEECLEHAKQKFDEAIGQAKMLWTKIWLQHDRDNLVLYSPSHPPESECRLRKLALKLFGRRGWKIRWAHILFSIGYGIALHDYAHQVWELKGTVLSIEGGYVGFAIMLVTVLYLAAERRLSLKKRRWNYGSDKS